jgi:hypothetical protein
MLQAEIVLIVVSSSEAEPLVGKHSDCPFIHNIRRRVVFVIKYLPWDSWAVDGHRGRQSAAS